MDAMAFHILCSFEIAVNSSFKIQDFTYSHYAMIVPNLHEKKTAIGNQREACIYIYICTCRDTVYIHIYIRILCTLYTYIDMGCLIVENL